MIIIIIFIPSLSSYVYIYIHIGGTVSVSTDFIPNNDKKKSQMGDPNPKQISIWNYCKHMWPPKSRIHIKDKHSPDIEANNQECEAGNDIPAKGELSIKSFFGKSFRSKSDKIKTKKLTRLEDTDMVGKLVIVVSDNGCGLSEVNLNRYIYIYVYIYVYE
jgi:hypothetical protein